MREGSKEEFGPFLGQILTFPDSPFLQIESNFYGLKWLEHVSQTKYYIFYVEGLFLKILSQPSFEIQDS